MKMLTGTTMMLLIFCAFPGLAQEADSYHADDSCTDIVVGRLASVDGSVITSHTGCCSECRVHVVPAQTFKKGDMAPVYYGLQDVKKPLHEYGDIIGYIPQVEKTYAYFHTGYPQMNEHQLAIGESTLSQKKELQVDRTNGKQIMTIEQAMLFALQRCKTARQAIDLITSLIEKYGFLPSCGPESEGLCIADPNEAAELYGSNPDEAKRYLTDYTNSNIKKIVQMYKKLRSTLISKYTNNKQGS